VCFVCLSSTFRAKEVESATTITSTTTTATTASTSAQRDDDTSAKPKRRRKRDAATAQSTTTVTPSALSAPSTTEAALAGVWCARWCGWSRVFLACSRVGSESVSKVQRLRVRARCCNACVCVCATDEQRQRVLLADPTSRAVSPKACRYSPPRIAISKA
jgi:hypothetical protein